MCQSYQNLGIFKVQNHFWRPNFIWSSWKWFSHLNINLGEQLSLRSCLLWRIFIKVYLVKICLNFTGSDSKSVISYWKIIWLWHMRNEYLLNFTWYNKKFHNCNHTNVRCQRELLVFLDLIEKNPPQSEDFVKMVNNLVVHVQSNNIRMQTMSVHWLRAFVGIPGMYRATLGDLTQKFPTYSNLILYLNFYTNADPKST